MSDFEIITNTNPIPADILVPQDFKYPGRIKRARASDGVSLDQFNSKTSEWLGIINNLTTAMENIAFLSGPTANFTLADVESNLAEIYTWTTTTGYCPAYVPRNPSEGYGVSDNYLGMIFEVHLLSSDWTDFILGTTEFYPLVPILTQPFSITGIVGVEGPPGHWEYHDV